MLPLEKRFLSDKDAARLYRQHPEVKNSFEKYCPTCLTEKTYVDINGNTTNCDCKGQLNLHKQYLNSGIGVLYQRYSWDDYKGDPKLKGTSDVYLAQSDKMVGSGLGIIANGTYGVGKTFGLTMLCKSLLREGFSVFTTTFTAMIEMFTDGWTSREDKEIFQEKMSMSQVLLLDDLGKEMRNKSTLAESTFDHVLRSRVQNGRPTFITTNMDNDEMHRGYGGAVMSLLDETSITISVSGEDFRKKAGSRKIQEVLAGKVRPIV